MSNVTWVRAQAGSASKQAEVKSPSPEAAPHFAPQAHSAMKRKSAPSNPQGGTWTRAGSGAGECWQGGSAWVQLPRSVSHPLLQSRKPKTAGEIPEKTQSLPFSACQPLPST